MNLAQDIREAYHTLDLMPGATWAEVKSAYRRLARALHPDLNPGSQGADMARVNRAYQRLDDFMSQGRQAADGYRPYQFESWAPRQGQRPFHYETFRPQRPHSARPAAEPSQPVRPAPRPAPSPRPLTHPAPRPAALAPVAPLAATPPAAPTVALAQPPAFCRLRGLRRQGQDLVYQVEVSGRPRRLELPVRDRRECSACAGSGRPSRGRGPCPVCAGRGHLTSSRLVLVDLPVDWRHGQVLSLPGQPGQANILVELLPNGGRA
ncbi:MAG: DnaJ domain-containing protein [Pseudomonadota bacterium]